MVLLLLVVVYGLQISRCWDFLVLILLWLSVTDGDIRCALLGVIAAFDLLLNAFILPFNLLVKVLIVQLHAFDFFTS